MSARAGQALFTLAPFKLVLLPLSLFAVLAACDRQTKAAPSPRAPGSTLWLLARDARDDAIHATDTEDSLSLRYGAANVSPGRMMLGEGESAVATVLFAGDSTRRLVVQWGDSVRRAHPVRAEIGGAPSRWSVYPGVSLGARLTQLERLNGGAFQLAGFEWDYAGTVTDWKDGVLETVWPAPPEGGQRVWLRLKPAQTADAALQAQVSGDRDFLSSHPAMRALDPAVYQLSIVPR
jgi:hypothetical protein